MDVRPVDPRDQTWEISGPAYRGYFHEADGASDEHELTGTDIRQVLAWAESHRAGRTYVV